MPALGHLENVQVGCESAAAYGTAVAAAWDVGYIIGGSTNIKRDEELVESIGQRNLQEISEIVLTVDGTIDCTYQHARALWWALGSVAHTGTQAPYVHTITELNMPPSLTIIESHVGTAGPNVKNTYSGVRINTLKLSIEKGAAAKLSISWIGKTLLGSTTGQAAVFSTQAVFPPFQCQAFIGTNSADPTTQLFDIQSAEINIDNQLDPMTACTSATITQLPPKGRKYTGSINVAFETDDLHQRFVGATGAYTVVSRQTPVAFKIFLTDGATPVNSLLLTLYGVKFSSGDRPLQVGGIIVNKLDFNAVSLGSCIANDAISGANFGSAVA